MKPQRRLTAPLSIRRELEARGVAAREIGGGSERKRERERGREKGEKN